MLLFFFAAIILILLLISVSTSVYIGVGIGVFVFVLIAVAVIVIVNKRRRRMLHIEPLNSRYSPRGDAIVDTDNVPRSSPKLCHQTHRGIINKHSYLELDGNGGYVDIADVASSIYPPKRALPGPPDATRTAENGYLTLVTASLPRDISEPFKTEDNKLHSAYVTSSATPMTTEISMHKLSTL
ncbi:hypothetical protein DPMN_084430 [Dreissena polymorpha]|uniref:Uncharacterized protein n=1 Tax=Dreissena polymorpha TaxID=45954 RepID=A0A9D3YAR3_DREPO|nr:hypothetical protein DPMN_084430 [Dreissena polymorpha]